MPPPVLLVHGFASSYERNWREAGWVDLLAEAGRVVIELDLPGHGRADKPHAPEAYAGLHSSVCAALPSGAVVDAIGFSLGAELLLQAAVESPESFRRLVIAGAGARMMADDDEVVQAEREAAARAIESGQVAEGDPAFARAMLRFADAPGQHRAALAACMRRPRQGFDVARLAAITGPVLLVMGERDFAGPAEPLLEALPDGRLVVLRGADHFGTAKDPRFMTAALDFLGSAAGCSG